MNRYIALQNIVELGSFSKAAEKMGYSQSALSQMLSSLETELGLKLLHRNRTGAKLTYEGKELFPFVEQLIYQYEALQEKNNEIKGLDTGVIRMGTISSVSVHWLPSVLKEFQEQHPGIQFILHQGDYTSIQEWIKTGAIDFGFVTAEAVTGIETFELKKGAMMAILPKGHPLAQYDVIPLQQLETEPFILLEEGHYSEPLEIFQAEKIQPQIKYTLHDDYSIMTMVEAGLGISILPELVLHRNNYALEIRPTDPPIYRSIAVGYKGKGSLSMASRRFLKLLKERVPDLP